MCVVTYEVMLITSSVDARETVRVFSQRHAWPRGHTLVKGLVASSPWAVWRALQVDGALYRVES